MTIVHLLRHGEVYNPERVLYGRLPGYQLSLRGRQQADVVAKYLAARPIGYLVCSPLERAQQTAAPLAAALGLDVRLDERLIEAANSLQGKRVDSSLRLIGDARNWPQFRNPLRPSWGEPYTEIADRMLAAVLDAVDIADRAAEVLDADVPAEIVCISHQLPIYTLRRTLEGQHLFHDPRKRECALASVTTVTFIDHVAVGVDYAEPAAAIVQEAVPGA